MFQRSFVDGFANGHVRMGVRFRSACESLRIANPHHRTALLVYRAHAYEVPTAGQFAQYQEGLRITVGFARVRFVFESMRIANPHHSKKRTNDGGWLGGKRVELSPRGASCEPNHRFYGPVMEGWEAALESCSCWAYSHIRL